MGKRTIQFKFYHNSKRQPIITKCTIIEPNNDKAVGLAICSNLDPFNGKIGKKIALGRAFKALKNQSSCSGIRRVKVEKKVAPWINNYYKCLFIHNICIG